NNEGSITKRPDGRWEARISLDEGKRKSYFGRTRQEVARKLTEALRDRDKGLPLVGERQTVAQYAAAWLGMVEPTIGVTSIPIYERHLRLRILPALGSIPLSKLSAQHLQGRYAALLRQGVGTATVRQTHVILHHMLKDAMRLGLVQRNISELVDAPRA